MRIKHKKRALIWWKNWVNADFYDRTTFFWIYRINTYTWNWKNTKNYVSSEFVNYLQFITIDMMKKLVSKQTKNEQIHDAIVQFLRCRDFIFFVDQVGSFSDQNSMNSRVIWFYLQEKFIFVKRRHAIRIPLKFQSEKFIFTCWTRTRLELRISFEAPLIWYLLYLPKYSKY